MAPDARSDAQDPAPAPRGPVAAILLVGNELLSGKVEDQNARYLVRELRALGVEVGRIEVIPDVVEEIVASVRALSQRFEIVFSSGGVGPTHDDVTLPAVAAAFGMKLVRHPELERLIREHVGNGLHERDLRMAELPDGARLEHGPAGPGRTWPVVVVRNVWVLPGVPAIFRRKFEMVRELFRSAPIHGRALFSREPEGAIASAIDAVVAAYPAVSIGSYPEPEADRWCVRITFDGRDPQQVDRALQDLATRLGPALVAVE